MSAEDRRRFAEVGGYRKLIRNMEAVRMSGAHEVPKTEAPVTREPAEQKFTVVVYDEGGRVSLFRQIGGYSAAGVLTQYTEQVSIGNSDYGKDTTDESVRPFYFNAGMQAHKAVTEP